MPYDRAGYLNSCGGCGSQGRLSNGFANGRINDSKLLKKELHYVETFVDNHNEECNRAYNDSCCDNFNSGCYGSGDSCGGYGGCGGFGGCGEIGGYGGYGGCGEFGGGCGEIGGGCGEIGGGCGEIGGYGGYGGCGEINGCGGGCDGYVEYGGCGEINGGCGPCFDNWNKPCREETNNCNCKPKKIKKKYDPCNPFCKPCYKPTCNNPCKKPCKCNNCVKSYKKINKCC